MNAKKEARRSLESGRATVREHVGILARLEGDIHLDPMEEAKLTALFAAICYVATAF